MNLQTIKSLDDKVEYVLLPVATYNALRHQITEQLKHTQEELATLMGVTQAYISKIKNQEKVTTKMLTKVKQALSNTATPNTGLLVPFAPDIFYLS